MICGVRTEKDDCISMDTLFIFVWITKDSNKVICKWSFACVSLVGAGKGGCKVCLNENEKDTRFILAYLNKQIDFKSLKVFKISKFRTSS